jgi:F420H(2)-dependent quinone reductase
LFQPTSDTDGREGGTLEGRPIVIVTTTGAKTGNIRKNPVMRVKVGDTYVAVASNGGAGDLAPRDHVSGAGVTLTDAASDPDARASSVKTR